MSIKTDIKALKNFEKLSARARQNLEKRLGKLNLLTPDFANAKTAKNQGLGFQSVILHLSPSNLSGFNICPAASTGCRAACLNTAGRGRFDSIQLARLRKTLFFVKLRDQFLRQLDSEIFRLRQRAAKIGQSAVVRLNGTSDLQWELFKIDGLTLFQRHVNVQFYDYTKLIHRLKRPLPFNYHLTFSRSETNAAAAETALELGFNVATVFDVVPETYAGRPVISGDKTDLRFLDAPGVIVGLTAKGKAKRDFSGFVIRNVVTYATAA